MTKIKFEVSVKSNIVLEIVTLQFKFRFSVPGPRENSVSWSRTILTRDKLSNDGEMHWMIRDWLGFIKSKIQFFNH